ncbi:MAG TPA: peptidoglycan-binding domain-containing protein [Terriglobales bacterium]|nr:peptidoglycan-binding domain-containing protein [Terriglobales bacterium]
MRPGISAAARWTGAVCLLFAASMLAGAQAQTSSSGSQPVTKPHTSAHSSSKKHKKTKSSTSWRRGQQKIDPARAKEIQQALIREHYLAGPASGKWDDASQKAMERYQADNGWQTKTIPDSRALIKMGLGPDQAHLLNPESAMTNPPQTSKSATSSKPASTTPPAEPPAANPPQ